MASRKRTGQIIISAGADVWPHELLTAKALAEAGYRVEFRVNQNREYVKSPDILINDQKWELKSPTSHKLAAVERNLKKAYHQSPFIVFDSRRMGKLPDKSIQRELVKQFKLTKSIKSILFINRKRSVVDISTLH